MIHNLPSSAVSGVHHRKKNTMQIVFRFNGSEELVVSNHPGGVLLERIDRDEPTDRSEHDGGPPSPHRAYWASRTRETTPLLVAMSRGQARSIASALMQAAAEA